jgi:hypothetical protein
VREVSINRWCDYCLRDGQRSEAFFAFTVQVSPQGMGGKPTPRLLETCEKHSAEVDVLMNLLQSCVPAEEAKSLPSTVPAPGKLIKKRPCVLCFVESTYRGDLVRHYRERHQVVVVQPENCPECGKSYKAMAYHRSRVHGHDSIIDVEELARAKLNQQNEGE